MRENRSPAEVANTDLMHLYMNMLNAGPGGFGNEKSHDLVRQALLEKANQTIGQEQATVSEGVLAMLDGQTDPVEQRS
jgi:hypothetical protein